MPSCIMKAAISGEYAAPKKGDIKHSLFESVSNPVHIIFSVGRLPRFDPTAYPFTTSGTVITV